MELNKAKQEILEDLKLIQFDKEKHHSLREAMAEVLNDERYIRVMNDTTGIITHSSDANMLKKIIEAYHRLKKYDDRTLLSAIQETVEEELDEFIILKYNESILMKKDKENAVYRTQTNNCSYQTIYFYDDKIYNIQGRCIYKKPIVWFQITTNNLIYVIPKEKLQTYYKGGENIPEKLSPNEIKEITKLEDISKFKVYIPTFGERTVNSSENIEKILEGLNDSQKEDFIEALAEGKKFPFLEQNQVVQFCKDGFINVKQQDHQICYYHVKGEKIISSDQDNYCYIEESFETKEDNRHIIIIGKIGNNLNKVYGYYDLDNRCELGIICYASVIPWMGYAGCAMDFNNTVYIINSEGKSQPFKECKSNRYFPIESVYGNDYDFKIYTKDKRNLGQKYNHENYYIANNLTKVQEGLYILKYKYNNAKRIISDLSKYEVKIPTNLSALLMIKPENPPKVSQLYRDISLFSYQDQLFLATTLGGKIVKLTFQGAEIPLEFSKKIPTRDKQKHTQSDIDFQNSVFLEDHYKKILSIPVNKSKEKKQAIISSHQQYLKTVDEISIKSNLKQIDANRLSVQEINPTGFALLESLKKNYILYQSNDNCFFYGDAVQNCFLDEYNNITIVLDYETFYREILVDCTGKMLIGMSKNIQLEHSSEASFYIVTHPNGTKQAFDINAVPLTIPCEDIDFINKYYATKAGKIQKVEQRMIVKMCGYIYLLEDEKDYMIYENKEYQEMLEEAKKLVLCKKKED